MTEARLCADVESSVELLRTIAAVLDIREVLPRVSEIANKVLAHDLLTMMYHDRGGQILIEAASTDEFRGLSRFTKADDSEPEEGFVIIDDFTTATLPTAMTAATTVAIVACRVMPPSDPVPECPPDRPRRNGRGAQIGKRRLRPCVAGAGSCP